ncbi:hypothetical protein [Clostridium sp. 1001283B150210_160208_E6]|uniref:hypothetical protein n=1 Tax=Clostridium sp. 1001283B150210_160208_E6 TaxID=2787129 RepID=UPI001A9AAF47|nr:hypothetical protein [Clostridium sp. 1001283B150210_160208_E6]
MSRLSLFELKLDPNLQCEYELYKLIKKLENKNKILRNKYVISKLKIDELTKRRMLNKESFFSKEAYIERKSLIDKYGDYRMLEVEIDSNLRYINYYKDLIKQIRSL